MSNEIAHDFIAHPTETVEKTAIASYDDDDAELDELLNEKPLALTLEDIRAAGAEASTKQKRNGANLKGPSGAALAKGDIVWAPYGKRKGLEHYPAIVTNCVQKKGSGQSKVVIVFLPAANEVWPLRPQKFKYSHKKLLPYGCKQQLEFEEREAARPYVESYNAYSRYLIDAPPPAIGPYEYFVKIHNRSDADTDRNVLHDELDFDCESVKDGSSSESESEVRTDTNSDGMSGHSAAFGGPQTQSSVDTECEEDDSDFGKHGELLVADAPTDVRLLDAYFSQRMLDFASTLVKRQFQDAAAFLNGARLGKRRDLNDIDTFTLGCFDEQQLASPPPSTTAGSTNSSAFNSPNSKASLRSTRSKAKVEVKASSNTNSASCSPVLSKRRRKQTVSSQCESVQSDLATSSKTKEDVARPPASEAELEHDLTLPVYYYFKHVVAEADGTRYNKRLRLLQRAVPYPFGTVTNDADKRRIRERYTELCRTTLGQHATMYDGFFEQDFVELAVISQVTQRVLRSACGYSKAKVLRCIQYGSRYDRRKVRSEARRYGEEILRRCALKRAAAARDAFNIDEEEEEEEEEEEATEDKQDETVEEDCEETLVAAENVTDVHDTLN